MEEEARVRGQICDTIPVVFSVKSCGDVIRSHRCRFTATTINTNYDPVFYSYRARIIHPILADSKHTVATRAQCPPRLVRRRYHEIPSKSIRTCCPYTTTL